MEKGPNYKSYFKYCTENCTFLIKSFTHDCVIYHNSTFIEATSCSSINNAICAYNYLSDSTQKTLCSQRNTNCVQGDYFSTSNCLCYIEKSNQTTPLADFHIGYQNLAYKALTKEMSYIGLEKTSEGYKWSDSKEINYTNWSPNAQFEENLKYGALSHNGWILTTNNSVLNSSLIWYYISNSKNASIHLEYDSNKNIFKVKVTDPLSWLQQENISAPEILCFTDASIKKLFEKLPITLDSWDEEFAHYFFEPLEIQSGYYWCEGFLYPNLEVVASNKYLLR